MTNRFELAAGNRFACGWNLRNGRTVAVLHEAHDPDGWVLKGDSFGGWRPAMSYGQAVLWADMHVKAAYPHAVRYPLIDKWSECPVAGRKEG